MIDSQFSKDKKLSQIIFHLIKTSHERFPIGHKLLSEIKALFETIF